MGHRDMIWSRHQPAQLLAWGIRFFLAAALTATQTPGDYAPFALGCVAACGPGAGGIAALLGAGVGAVLFLDFSGALPFLAAAILIFTTAAAFQGLKLLEGPLFHPLAGAGLFLAVSGIYVLQSLSPLRNLAPYLAATVLVGISAWYYQPLLQAGGERPEPDSLLFLAGSILLALVVCGILTTIFTGINPVQVYVSIFMGAFGTARKTWITFQNVAILLLVSLALTPAFRMSGR